MLPREPTKVRVPKVKPKGPVAAKPSGVFATPQADKTFKPKPAPASVQRATRDANRVATKPVVKKGGLIGTITGAAKLGQAALRETADVASKAAPIVAAGVAPAITGTLAAIDAATGAKTLNTAKKIVSNTPKDAAELAITTPTSLVKLGDTAIHHPEKVPGMLAQPYKDLVRDPGKMITERPLSTGLMVAPTVKVPGRVVGRGLRLAGKQTLERAPKTLPGTAMKETRSKSRDAAVNAMQKRSDAKKPAPVMSKKDVQHRADAFYDFATQERLRIRNQTIKTLRKKYKDLPKAERDVLIANRVDRASKAADVKTTKMFASEFGANARLSSGAAERNAAAGVRKQAVQRVKVARQAVSVAQAEHSLAMTEARLALAKSKRSPQLTALEQQHRRALADLARVQQEHRATRLQTAVQAERANTQVAKVAGNARVSEVRGEIAGVKGQARVQQAVAKQQANARVGLERMVGEAKVSQARTKTSPGLQVAETDLRAAQGQLAKVRKDMKGGPYSLTGAARLRVAKSKVAAADTRARAERARIKGVAPQQAEALRSALTNNERAQATPAVAPTVKAGLAPTQQGRVWNALTAQEAAIAARSAAPNAVAVRVREARQAARDTAKAVAEERARIAGVPPVQHDALMRAMAGEQTARLELGAARGERAAAKAQHIQAKQAMTDAKLVDPAQTGRLFDHKADARKVIQRLPVNPDGTPAFTMISAGKRYAVVPNVASSRLMKHRAVGTSPATMAKVMRVSRRQLTNTVLPTSIKWLSGQVGEAGLRATVAGAGPLDVLRVNKVVRQMNRGKKGSGDEFLMRITGGQFGLTGTARDFAAGKRSLADEFVDTGLEKPAALASKVGATAPARVAKAGWNEYSRAVFDKVNGVVENTARKAMAGQALKDSHLMERSILGLSDKAIHDAALGLKATENQVALGRAVDRMYGKYQKFSPETRSLLLHWTPFLPWYLNSAKFLMKVLPVDHPVHAALIASTNVALEDWRKEHKLSLHGDHRPVWQMGGYPGGGGVLPVGKVTPFAAAADPLQAAADLTLPQFSGPWKNAGGVDWKWQRLKHPGYAGKEFSGVERGLRALTSGVESQVPLVSQAGRLSGVTPRYVDHKASPDSPGTVGKKLINPLYPIKSNADHTSSMGAAVKVPVVKVRTVKVKTVKVK